MNVIENRRVENEVINSYGSVCGSSEDKEHDVNITKMGGGCESEENLGGPVFEPRLYMQRYSFVQQQLTKHEVTSVVDFGCAECKIARFLTHVPSVERIVLVDIDRASLELNQHVIRPLTADYLYRRQGPLHVAVYAGSVTRFDSAISGVEAVTMVEVIEHLYPDVLSAACEMIFSQLRPRVVIMTTPNSEFNQLFPGHAGFRHWDHKFEWTRQEFQTWCEDITKKYPGYACEFTGVGNPTPGSEHLGFCSQAVIFVRTTGREQTGQTETGTKGIMEVDERGTGDTANGCVSNSRDMRTGNKYTVLFDRGKGKESGNADIVSDIHHGNETEGNDKGSEVDSRIYVEDQKTKSLLERTLEQTENSSVAIANTKIKHIPDHVKPDCANLIRQEMSSKCALTSGWKCTDLNDRNGALPSSVSDADSCTCPIEDVTVSDRTPEYARVPGQRSSEQLSNTNPANMHADGDGNPYTHSYELIAECSHPYQDTPTPSLTESLLLEVRYTLPQYRHGAEYLDLDGKLYYQVPLEYIMARRKIKANFNENQLRAFLQENDFKLSTDGDHVLVLEEYDDWDLRDDEGEAEWEADRQSNDTSIQRTTDTVDAVAEESWDN